MNQFIEQHITRQASIAPLVTLRIVFGALMLFATIRFAANGWIDDLYISPELHFPFFGLEWIQALPGWGMYMVFVLLGLSALAIMLGAFYRIATPAFFVLFTYIELIDKSTYLNHYYLVTLIAFLLCLVPAHGMYSLDALRNKKITRTKVPVWMISVFMLQIGVVYFFAGIAKLTPHWLFEAMPLKIWLPARADMPFIGGLLDQEWVAYLFAWFGAFYDLTIVFFLLWKRTRPFAYAVVVVFHVLTWMLFQIGMFPWLMIGLTTVFFSSSFHARALTLLGPWPKTLTTKQRSFSNSPLLLSFLGVYVVVQLLLPLRCHFGNGDLYWLEEGYRFSWRVMLMEKSGHITFRVQDLNTGKTAIVDHESQLTQLQATQMCTQPDMILQMAAFIERDMKLAGHDVAVYADGFVSLNGSGSKRFIDPTVNLLDLDENADRNQWVYAY